MPVIGPKENSGLVSKAYEDVMDLLKQTYNIQKYPSNGVMGDWGGEREARNANLKEALRLLFELESWEAF